LIPIQVSQVNTQRLNCQLPYQLATHWHHHHRELISAKPTIQPSHCRDPFPRRIVVAVAGDPFQIAIAIDPFPIQANDYYS